jgi:hypothetical protein
VEDRIVSTTAREVIAEFVSWIIVAERDANDGIAADKIIDALNAAGFVIVPTEPTEEMVNVADAVALLELPDDIDDRSEERRRQEFVTAYRAMIAAAPHAKGQS